MKIIDLSLPIADGIRGFEISPATSLEVEGWNTTTLSLYSHCGTHMDAPRHFIADGRTIDEQPLGACVGPAIVVNLAPAEPQQLLNIEDLASVAELVEPGVRLLLRTDWYKRHGTPSYRDDLPRISLDLANWMVEKQVAMVGVEAPSVADVNNLQEVTDVHRALLGGNVVIVEGLMNLDQITSKVVQFVGLPLRVIGGDGTPIRAIAIE